MNIKIAWVGLVLAGMLLIPGAVHAQLGADDEGEEEEEKVEVPIEFRVGVHAGALNGEKEGGTYGIGIAVDPKAWPVLFASSVDFLGDELEDNYNANFKTITELGLSDKKIVPYVGAGVNYYTYKTEVEFGRSGEFYRVDGFALDLSGGARFSLGIFNPFLQADAIVGEDDTFYGVEGGLFLTF
jgi:hypothetical protein